jgi:hypothetical protein
VAAGGAVAVGLTGGDRRLQEALLFTL